MKKIVSIGFIFLMLSLSACLSAPNASSESTPQAELRNTLWKLTELDGKAIRPREGQRMASLTLRTTDPGAKIVTACNQGSAGYKLEGNSLKFGLVMATKMMCPEDQNLEERAFFKVIDETVRFEIKGETLQLFDAGNRVLASFHAEYL